MVKRYLTPQSLLIIATSLVALLVFNLTRPGLKNELQSSFDTWYAESSSALTIHTEGPYQGREITVTISVTVGGSQGDSASKNQEWKLPNGSLSDPEQRARVARVLQLIAESQLFSIRRSSASKTGGAYLAIAVVDPTRRFETTISFDEVKENIQLQNLLKLLEVFAASPPAPPMNPNQL